MKRKHWWIIVTRRFQFPCGGGPFKTRREARDKKREYGFRCFKAIKVQDKAEAASK